MVATVTVGNAPVAVAVTPDGKHAYVTNGTNGNSVSVIDTASNTVVATVPVGITPGAVAITPDGRYAYVTTNGSVTSPNYDVWVIATATNKVVARIATGPPGYNPYGIAITPNGKQAYLPNYTSNTVLVVDTASKTTVATIQMGIDAFPVDVVITPDGKYAYVTNGLASASATGVWVIDTASKTVVATVTVGSQPWGIGIGPPPGP